MRQRDRASVVLRRLADETRDIVGIRLMPSRCKT